MGKHVEQLAPCDSWDVWKWGIPIIERLRKENLLRTRTNNEYTNTKRKLKLKKDRLSFQRSPYQTKLIPAMMIGEQTDRGRERETWASQSTTDIHTYTQTDWQQQRTTHWDQTISSLWCIDQSSSSLIKPNPLTLLCIYPAIQSPYMHPIHPS